MKNHKEINRQIEGLLGDVKLYDLRRELKVVDSDLTLEEAQARLTYVEDDERHLYSITSSYPDNYCEDVGLALKAAKQISEKAGRTFVLSLEDNEWKASYGDWGDCAEYRGGNPAYVTCMAVLKFMGKL